MPDSPSKATPPEQDRPEWAGNAEVVALIEAAHDFGARGWTPATSGNYSLRLDRHTLLMTRSGVVKRRLDRRGLMAMTSDGTPLTEAAPSAEAARPVAEEELAQMLDICADHAPNTILTVMRELTDAGVREQYGFIAPTDAALDQFAIHGDMDG